MGNKKQLSPWKNLDSIRFIWPITYLDNIKPDVYIPIYAPSTVTAQKSLVLTKTGLFPWNTDQNIKTPLVNKVVLDASI